MCAVLVFCFPCLYMAIQRVPVPVSEVGGNRPNLRPQAGCSPRTPQESERAIHALPVSEFREGAYPPADAVCAICLEDYTNGIKLVTLPCAHHFHQSCSEQWVRCPLLALRSRTGH